MSGPNIFCKNFLNTHPRGPGFPGLGYLGEKGLKARFSWVSREGILTFLIPNPSRRRHPPHRTPSFVLFLLSKRTGNFKNQIYFQKVGGEMVQQDSRIKLV